jgi:hypothetical protein
VFGEKAGAGLPHSTEEKPKTHPQKTRVGHPGRGTCTLWYVMRFSAQDFIVVPLMMKSEPYNIASRVVSSNS